MELRRLVCEHARRTHRFLLARDSMDRESFGKVAMDLLDYRIGIVKQLPDSWGRVFRSQPAEVKWWRSVFLETSPWEPSSVRTMLDELVAKGYFRDCAGVVFGDLAPSGPNRTKLSGENLKAGREEMERIKNDFASKVTCPVYDGYPYGHMSLSRTIDFLREKTIFEDGVMRQ